MKRKLVLPLLFFLLSPMGFAWDDHNSDLDYAQTVFVRATRNSNGSWRFDVTVRHRDEGWTHYADRWVVVSPVDQKVIAERVLLHPHDNEQPFTRSQSGIQIPDELTHVIVRARCNVHGFGGREIAVELKPGKSEYHEVVVRE
jgi:hypothetical protein